MLCKNTDTLCFVAISKIKDSAHKKYNCLKSTKATCVHSLKQLLDHATLHRFRYILPVSFAMMGGAVGIRITQSITRKS